jgi:hypothetical protein
MLKEGSQSHISVGGYFSFRVSNVEKKMFKKNKVSTDYKLILFMKLMQLVKKQLFLDYH